MFIKQNQQILQDDDQELTEIDRNENILEVTACGNEPPAEEAAAIGVQAEASGDAIEAPGVRADAAGIRAEASGVQVETPKFSFFMSQQGKEKLFFQGVAYNRTKVYKDRKYWLCEFYKNHGCMAKITTKTLKGVTTIVSQLDLVKHCHDSNPLRAPVANALHELKVNYYDRVSFL